MNRLINFFLGYSEYTCPEGASADVLGFLLENKIPFFGEYSDGETVYFSVLSKYEKRHGMPCGCKRVRSDGFLLRLKRKKHRAGLLFGAVFCAFAIAFSMNFVWDIEIDDKENEEKLLAVLNDAGLKTGSYIPTLEEDIVEIKALLSTDEFSYISITLEGTVAHVQTEKRVTGVIPDDSTAPSNLIASSDGVIVRYEVYSGDSVCRVGQTVEKGELLISGFDETAHNGTRVVRARGAVYAEVEKSFSVSFNSEVQEKVYTGKECVQKRFSVCGLEMVTGTECDFELFDEESKKHKLTVFGTVELPVYVTETVYREYEYKTCTLTREQTELMARKEYLKKLEEVSRDGQVLYRDVKKTHSEEGVSISCTLGMVCNIAKEERIGLPTG